MPSLLIIRHSISVANEQHIVMGAKLDSPLSDKGIELAQQKAKLLLTDNFKPDRVYTSSLLRSKQTAEIILNSLKTEAKVTELSDLNERDFGDYDELSYEALFDAFNKYGDNPPSIEPVAPFIERVVKALEQIRSESKGDSLVVTHSNPLMVMQAALFKPSILSKFWEIGDPHFCEGFTYNF